MLKVKLRRTPREAAGQPCALPLADAAAVPPALRAAAAAAGFTGRAGQVVAVPLPGAACCWSAPARRGSRWTGSGPAAAPRPRPAMRCG
ncbi:hypothetical protein ACFQY5_15575 [Paeniroseomonas aquatica]|uniref:hypothetical protein n=1 Tax=Paeniroseomonas aquatica TaxID=373043 RepID=UPI00360EF5B7